MRSEERMVQFHYRLNRMLVGEIIEIINWILDSQRDGDTVNDKLN